MREGTTILGGGRAATGPQAPVQRLGRLLPVVLLAMLLQAGCRRSATPSPQPTPPKAGSAAVDLTTRQDQGAQPGAEPRMRLNGSPVDLEAMTAKLRHARGHDRDFRVVISADDDLPYGDLQMVLIAVANADIGRITFRARDGRAWEALLPRLERSENGGDGPATKPKSPVLVYLDLSVHDGKVVASVAGREATDLGTALDVLLADQLKPARAGPVGRIELGLRPTRGVPYRELMRAYEAGLRAGFPSVVFITA